MPIGEVSGYVSTRKKQAVFDKLSKRKQPIHLINVVTVKFPNKRKTKNGWKFEATHMYRRGKK